MADKYLLIIVGPTAVGKTELSVRLAKKFDTSILSADSRQFYKEMTIGTAKPTLAEQNQVTHYFIDSHHITEEYNAGAYEKDALALLETIFKEKDIAILTGGSGLYVKTLCEGIDQMPESDLTIRHQLTTQYEQEGIKPLLAQLDRLDPDYGQVVDRSNTQRIIRALEVCLHTGLPYSSFRKQKKAIRPFHVVKIGLTRNRAELYARIDKRMDLMLQQGLAEEARQLLPYKNHNALQTVGYREVFDYLEGKYDYEEMVRLLKRNSRRYAKRQLTWFNKDPEIRWFHPEAYGQIVAYIRERIKNYL